MQEKFSNNAKNILNRLKIFLNLRTDGDLADYLGVAQNTLSGWKSRNIVDYELIISKIDNTQINLNWLLMGEGSPELNNSTNSELFVSDQKAEYITKINELENQLKKTDTEMCFDNKEIARMQFEIAELRAKLEYADTIINKLIKAT